VNTTCLPTIVQMTKLGAENIIEKTDGFLEKLGKAIDNSVPVSKAESLGSR
jgi:hypothetical protein